MQLEMHYSETLESAKAATAANIGEIINTVITTKKAAVLDEFERMVMAATTKLTESKDDLMKTFTSELGAIGHSNTFDIKVAQEVATSSIID